MAVDWDGLTVAVVAIVVPFVLGVVNAWLSSTRPMRRWRRRAEAPEPAVDLGKPAAAPTPSEVEQSAGLLAAAYARLRVLYDAEVAEAARMRAERDTSRGETHWCRNELTRLRDLLDEHGIHDPGPHPG